MCAGQIMAGTKSEYDQLSAAVKEPPEDGGQKQYSEFPGDFCRPCMYSGLGTNPWEAKFPLEGVRDSLHGVRGDTLGRGGVQTVWDGATDGGVEEQEQDALQSRKEANLKLSVTICHYT